ncbi:hypothetical protein BFINE_54270 [Bacteroides finegoldii DSM 17565]|nr:hypothetical protein BFINE_54270 [Bacteroides finegoldii DSM 17565]
MKKILNTFIFASLMAAVSSCTAKYEDINSNPYQPGDLSADDYALGSAMNNLAGCVVSPDVNTAQFTDCLLAVLWEDILPIPKHHGNVRFRTLTLKMAGQMFF